MVADGLAISHARQSDLPDIAELLTLVNLPPDGVAEYVDGFLIARDVMGKMVGCIGMERHGKLGLLRSAAVVPGLRRHGIGSRLTAAMLERAAASGIEELVLLTATARAFFAHRFEFKDARRADYDQRLASSPEWRLPCCSSAVCMKLDLDSRRRSIDPSARSS